MDGWLSCVRWKEGVFATHIRTCSTNLTNCITFYHFFPVQNKRQWHMTCVETVSASRQWCGTNFGKRQLSYYPFLAIWPFLARGFIHSLDVIVRMNRSFILLLWCAYKTFALCIWFIDLFLTVEYVRVCVLDFLQIFFACNHKKTLLAREESNCL